MSRVLRRWRIEPFDPRLHDRDGFGCGAPELDAYLRQRATQDVKRDVARVFVALSGNERRVQAYYSLSAASFDKEGLPPVLAKRLPHYPVPAVLLGRLAVDDRNQGQGLGAHLLIDALCRIERASQTLAVHAIVVDARDDNALAFYERFGFAPFADTERRLFLPMATVRQLVSACSSRR